MGRCLWADYKLQGKENCNSTTLTNKGRLLTHIIISPICYVQPYSPVSLPPMCRMALWITYKNSKRGLSLPCVHIFQDRSFCTEASPTKVYASQLIGQIIICTHSKMNHRHGKWVSHGWLTRLPWVGKSQLTLTVPGKSEEGGSGTK